MTAPTRDLDLGYDFSDEERRRLVHIVAALRECIKDEVEYVVDVDDGPDPRNTPLALEDQELFGIYLWQELTNLMAAIHREETLRVHREIVQAWARARPSVPTRGENNG